MKKQHSCALWSCGQDTSSISSSAACHGKVAPPHQSLPGVGCGALCSLGRKALVLRVQLGSPRGGSKGYHPCKGTSCSHLCCPPLACPKTSVKPGLKLFTSACAFPEKHSNIESHPLFPSPPAGQVYPMGAAVKNAHSHPKSQISAPVS